MFGEFFVKEKKHSTKKVNVIDDRSEKNSSDKKIRQEKINLHLKTRGYCLFGWTILEFSKISVSIMDFLAEDFQNRFCLASNPK